MKRKWWVLISVAVASAVLIWIWNARDDRVLWSKAYPVAAPAMTLTPDGRLAVAVGSELAVYDRHGRSQRLFWLPAGVVSLAHSDDGQLLAVTAGRFRKRKDSVIKLTWEGQITWRYTNEGTIQQLRGTRSGGAAFLSNLTHLVVLDASGTMLWREPVGVYPTSQYRIGSDGRFAYVSPSKIVPMSALLSQSARAGVFNESKKGGVVLDPVGLPRLTVARANGTPLWTQPASPSSPRLSIDSTGRVAVSDFGKLELFDQKGVQLWTIALPEFPAEARSKLATSPFHYARTLDSLVADDQGNVFCQEQSGFVHAFAVDGKHRWSFWDAPGKASSAALLVTEHGGVIFPYQDMRVITNKAATSPAGQTDFYSLERGLICLNRDGELQWRRELSGQMSFKIPKSAWEWRTAWARRFGLRESFYFSPPLIAPDGTIYQGVAARGRSWVFALRSDVSGK